MTIWAISIARSCKLLARGVAPPPGDTIWEQRCFIEKDDQLPRFVFNEPRGGVFRQVNLLVPPKDPRTQNC